MIGIHLWLHRLPRLAALIGEPVCYLPFIGKGLDAVAGWGRKKSFDNARRYAVARGIPCLVLEDGFLRSVGLGKDDAPLSLVIDDLGIYYDAATPSRLEAMVGAVRSADELARARAVIAAWRAGRVSKYNHLPEWDHELPDDYVLVADQTLGDAAVRCGLADAASFQRMLQAALDENPGCTVLVKIHPDVFAGRKQGHFELAALQRIPRVVVLAEDVHPVRLIESARAVYVVTSQMGFEGLLWGKPVRTFGMPFYAGWGLTRDALPAPARRGVMSLDLLAYAALIAYPRYVNPETEQRCEVEDVLDHVALQRRMRGRFPKTVYAVDFSRWKKPIVCRFFWGSEVRFVEHVSQVPAGGCVAVWGRKPLPGDLPGDARVVRLEDGFLRSVGLGADLITPLSWVLDERGIYYDATQPSDLEYHLQNFSANAALLARAASLRGRIVAAGLTKYNVGASGWCRPQRRQRVILVPGQVESDASIQYGASQLKTNMRLLQAVREANPDAWVVYKPHPDVLAGLRKAGQDEGEARRWCDELVTDVAMGELLDQVDEVHVLTSLTGFEALLRGKHVVCYGLPFYAGWGLTDDRLRSERRTRSLLLDELVAATLILYPTYVSRTTGRFTTPERALDELLEWRTLGGQRKPLWRRGLRWFLRWRTQ